MSDFMMLNLATGRASLVDDAGRVLARLDGGVTTGNADAVLRQATGRRLTTIGRWRPSEAVRGRIVHDVAAEDTP